MTRFACIAGDVREAQVVGGLEYQLGGVEAIGKVRTDTE